MSRLGLILYYLTRFWDRVANRFWTFTLDSFLRHKAKSYGSVHFYGPSRVVNAQGLTAGSNIHVNLGAWWVCDGGLTIGDNCHFGKDSTIYTRNHNHRGKAIPYDDTNISRPVIIHRNVWVGANVTILPGAEIGEGAIIGAGAVVHGKVPAMAIYGAASPSQIGARDAAHYHELDTAGHYGGAGGKLVISPKKNF